MAAWTDEMARKVTADWLDGFSAQQCADRLGGGPITRNAVISKIHRLGVSERQKTRSPRQAQRSWKPRQGAKAGQVAARLSMINARRKTQGGQPFETMAEFYADQDRRTTELAALEAMPEVEVAPANRRGVADIQDDQCRWPIGDPQRPGFHFCDHKKEAPGLLPYCRQHNARAFKPPVPKSYLPNVQTDSSRAIGDRTKSLEEFELMAVRR